MLSDLGPAGTVARHAKPEERARPAGWVAQVLCRLAGHINDPVGESLRCRLEPWPGEITASGLHILLMWPKLDARASHCRLHSEGQIMSKATTLAATALQLSEAANRKGSPEHDALKSLVALLSQGDRDEVRLVAGDSEAVSLPRLVVDLLRQVSAVLDRGDGVVVSEVARELTTSEAARLVGVSRPTLIGLLDKGEIKSHRVGTHRRVALGDVLAYRRQRISQQREAYEALMAEQDELGIYE